MTSVRACNGSRRSSADLQRCRRSPSLVMREVTDRGELSTEDRGVTTRRDVAKPLEIAAAQALQAHVALGKMSACTTVAEFAEAATEFMSAARGVSQSVAWLARTNAVDASERRRGFSAWFALSARELLVHPVQSELQQQQPSVYVSRLARGSGHPPIREAMTLPTIVAVKPKPEDFYFEGVDKRPAIELCAEYLERVTNLLDESKQAIKRFGLE